MGTKAEAVRAMFAGIAPRYDLLNHVLSFNFDRGWRRAVLSELKPRAGERALDACAGTADLALLLAERGLRVVAFDFCGAMLRLGQQKVKRSGHDVPLVEADALAPPFRGASFDVVTVAFGIRNLERPQDGLRALASLLRPGGRIGVLEFARPRNRVFRAIYYTYFQRLLPRIGGAVSGDEAAYRYLPSSVLSFDEPEALVACLTGAGLEEVRVRRLAMGAVMLVSGARPGGPRRS